MSVGLRFEVPTVSICAEAPVPTQDGGWKWRMLDAPECGREYVYTPDELRCTFVAFGAAVALIVSKQGVLRFRLTAHCLHTGRLLGVYQVRWWPEIRRFYPVDDPTILWYPRGQVPDVVVHGAFLSRGVSAPVSMVPAPLVVV